MVILRLALAGTLLLGAGCSDSGAAGSADGAEEAQDTGAGQPPASVVPDTAPPAGGDPTLEAGTDPVPAAPSAPGGDGASAPARTPS